ncbi:MAG TPA: PH domain-containing protein [Candidatus Nitrosocosmicus sp.]|nr:PH domain-containing protein [Candidatus Nitrosocosmicus sp.]
MSDNKYNVNTEITDEDEIDEIKKIANMLNPDEKVLVVAKQSRIKPGGSHFSPNVVYATDRRIILRDPTMLGLKQEIIDIPYNVITNAKIEKGILSASVIFNAPGLFNPNVPEKIQGVKRLSTHEHGEDGVIDAIPKKKAEDLVEVIRYGIAHIRAPTTSFGSGPASGTAAGIASSEGGASGSSGDQDHHHHHHQVSHADELEKLAHLKDRGIISEKEFEKMKDKIIHGDPDSGGSRINNTNSKKDT